jgi:hypothetical protein
LLEGSVPQNQQETPAALTNRRHSHRSWPRTQAWRGGAPLSPWGARSDAHFKTHRASRNVLLAPSLVSSEVSFTSCPTNSNAHFKTNRASCNRRSLNPRRPRVFYFLVQPCLPTLWIWNLRRAPLALCSMGQRPGAPPATLLPRKQPLQGDFQVSFNTILLIVLVVVLIGGGGFYFGL